VFDSDQFGKSIAETGRHTLFKTLKLVKTLKITALLPILECSLQTN